MDKLPQSQELFNDLYIKMSDKLEESENTLFTGVSIREFADVNYERFMESTYSRQFFIEESLYEKNLQIKCFIENEVINTFITESVDSLSELNGGELSFAQTILLENTCEQFNVKYMGDSEIIEEGFGTTLSIAGAGVAAYLGGAASLLGVVPIVGLTALGALPALAASLMVSSRGAREWDRTVEDWTGSIGLALAGTKSLLAKKGTSLGASNDNIINFDNIDTNPAVKKLFNTLSRNSNKDASIQGLGTLVEMCAEQNNAFSNTFEEMSEDNSSLKNFLRGKYSKRNHNVFTLILDSVFKSASSKGSEEYGTLIRFRKCLSEKLVDLYKFLMIANVSQSTDYRKIIRVMERGFHDDPEQLLSFMAVDSDEEQLTKENIKLLVRFRLYLENMAKDLKKGTFAVDKESSIYLTQRLSTVDKDIADYLSKNGKKIETVFESQREFEKKDYKYNKPDEKTFKRKSFGFGTSFKD